MTKLLEVRNLSTHFFTKEGVVRAVEDVSFDLKAGETLGLVGESGCGKSVSALSLMRLVPAPPGDIVAGEIVFEGRDILKLDDGDIRRIRGNRMAMIFQEPMTSLNPVMTIGRQAAEPFEIHRKMNRRRSMEAAADLLGRVRVPEARKRLLDYPHHLSGGMRQRVMIAMALACSPGLLIADEPTTALDVTIQAQLLELMKRLTRDAGSAWILITHNLGIVARYADRIHVMYAGRIVEQAPVRELFARPRHPYTIGLMASVPRLDQNLKEKLRPIEGQPPDLLNLPSGCAFHPRCRRRTEVCVSETPKLKSIAGGHAAACWHPVEEKLPCS
ncbi:MAG: ABC transporter ATP-binding protein [Thermodesulfobacteriota bacterium]